MADEGDLFLYGKKITAHNPRYMNSIGVATIHQEPSPVLDLTIAEEHLSRPCTADKTGRPSSGRRCMPRRSS